MKAKDLIKELQKLSPDEEIYIYEGQHVANDSIALQNAYVKIREQNLGRVILEYPGIECSGESVYVLV